MHIVERSQWRLNLRGYPTVFRWLGFVLIFSPLFSGMAETSLGTSPSGHYVTYHGTPLLLVGDSGTHCVLQNTNLNYKAWLDDCVKAGLNAVHVWSFVAPRQRLDGSLVEARYGYVFPGVTPWARRDSGPRAADGGFCWDLHRWDEGDSPEQYWPRLRGLCRGAQQRGLILDITVFWGWPKHASDWKFHPFNVINGGIIEDIPSPHVSRVQRIAEPGVEVFQETWSEDWPVEKKNQWLWERFCDKLIKETAPFDNIFFIFMDEHSYDEGNGGDHFRAFFQRRGCRWTDWDRRRASVDYVFEDIPHDPVYGRNSGVVKFFERSPVRPLLILEGGPYQGDAVRITLWSALTGGASYFFHNDEGLETVHTGIMQYDPNVPRAPSTTPRMEWMGIAARFFCDHVRDLDRWRPMNELVEPSSVFCFADPGNAFVLYLMPGKDETIQLDLRVYDNTFVARYFDPRQGEWLSETALEGGAVSTFERPSAEDWVLFVQRQIKDPVMP